MPLVKSVLSKRRVLIVLIVLGVVLTSLYFNSLFRFTTNPSKSFEDAENFYSNLMENDYDSLDQYFGSDCIYKLIDADGNETTYYSLDRLLAATNSTCGPITGYQNVERDNVFGDILQTFRVNRTLHNTREYLDDCDGTMHGFSSYTVVIDD